MNYLKPIELTHLTINPQLFPSETILQSQAGVGIYDGKNKDQRYQDGTLYLTSHRLIYVDRLNPHHHSCFLDMSLIRQTEYWIGFLASSPKITLLLGLPPQRQTSTFYDQHPTTDQSHILTHPAASHWACHVCGFSNPPEPKCGLCGIPRDLSTTARSESTSSPRPHSSFKASTGLKSTFQTRSLSDLRAGSKDSHPEDSLPDNPEEVLNQPTQTNEISCPSCTFLNHPSMARCEMCDSILGIHNLTLTNSAADPNLTVTDDPPDLQHSRAATPAPPSSFPSGSYIRLSFRKGGDKSFYLHLKKSLQSKTWKVGEYPNQATGLRKQQSTINSSISENSSFLNQQLQDGDLVGGHFNSTKPIGIDRILKNMDSQHQAHHAELTESLQDLQALMAKAKEMVQMAQSINARMSSLESSRTKTVTNDDDAELSDEKKKARLISSSLVKLGLAAPAVTSDMIDSDQDFAKELAKELGGLLNRKMDYQQEIISAHSANQSSATGIWPLDEIWCIWNRARGISLVSPAEMLSACQHLPEYTTPKIQLRTFKSGLRVLHTPYFSLEEFESRLIQRLTNNNTGKSEATSPIDSKTVETLDQSESLNKLSTLEIAHYERLSVNLTNELLQSVELPPSQNSLLPSPSSTINTFNSSSSIVRDFNPSTGDTYWFINLISDFTWVDPNF